jgi:hypothetical protein
MNTALRILIIDSTSETNVNSQQVQTVQGVQSVQAFKGSNGFKGFKRVPGLQWFNGFMGLQAFYGSTIQFRSTASRERQTRLGSTDRRCRLPSTLNPEPLSARNR